MTYSIFNAQGENVEGELFADAASAQAFMDTTDFVTEYGPVHVGELCETHDEGEKGKCPFCLHPLPHDKDADCIVGEIDLCIVCGVLHGEPCAVCGGRGFHVDGCDGIEPRITTMAELLRETAKQVGFLPADAQGFVRVPDPGTLPHLFPNIKPVAADLVEAIEGTL